MRRFNNYDLIGQPPVLAWNPIVMRCPGCGLDADPTFHPGRADKHCWHLRVSDMGAGNPKLPEWMREIKAGRRPAEIHDTEIYGPTLRRKPAVIATGFMGDPAWWDRNELAVVLEVMRGCPHHTFLLLTKWPERLAGVQFPDNAWAGISAANQADADLRIPALLRLPCRHRWVSVEPMLEEADLRSYLLSEHDKAAHETQYLERIGGNSRAKIRFVACGPETGPRARPCDPDWIINLRDQCEEWGCTFYDKREPGDGRVGNCGRDWPPEWRGATGV
jgi:protein gp37